MSLFGKMRHFLWLRSLRIPLRDPNLNHHHAVAHEGIGFPCWVLPDLMSFPETRDLYEFCCKEADDDGNTVIVAVVDGGVGDVLDIVPIDDSVTKLTARCEVCGHKGFFTVRKTCDTRTELIGGVDVYMPRTGDLYEFCCKDADDDGNTVIVAVVDGGVGDVLDIVPIDDSDTKLTARCEVCGHKGFFTVRKTFDTRTELIGWVDVYMPVCLKNYINNQIVIKASK
ncbi:hypothetical protein F2Q69_00041498 [Brassica cretica]|uniref:Thymidine kinase n=1 Tax=Brassica cretica TaxID=69181 RepID=A0A8S9NCZ0_BRACR|nr:hypothetical protein F2Q69_00041498 [Brassica cretica]